MARPVAEKTFANMLRIALNDEGPGVKLRRVADVLVRNAEAGESWAIQMIADRLDGKPVQQIDADVTSRTHEEALELLAREGSGNPSGPS